MSAVSRSPRAARARLASATLAASVLIGLGGAHAGERGVPVARGAGDVPMHVSTTLTRSADEATRTGAVDASMLERLIEVSRVQRQAAHSMGQLRGGILQGLAGEVLSGRLERKRLPRIERLAERAYADDALSASISASVASTLRPGDADVLLAHLLSPLGQRALDEEDAHAMDDGGAAFARFVTAFERHPEHDARLARAVEMEEVLGFAEVAGGLAIDLQRAMLGGIAFSMPASARAEIDGLLAELEAQRAATVEQMRAPMTHYLAFLYENLTLAEQDALLDFLVTPTSRRFSNALIRGMSEGMQRASIAFGDGLGRSLSVASIDEEI